MFQPWEESFLQGAADCCGAHPQPEKCKTHHKLRFSQWYRKAADESIFWVSWKYLPVASRCSQLTGVTRYDLRVTVVRRLSLSRVWARLRPAPPHPSADQATDARRQQEKKQLANHAQVFGLFNARYDNFISCEWGQVPFLLLPSSWCLESI